MTGRPSTYAKPDPLEVQLAPGAAERNRVRRLGDGGLLLEDAGELLERGGGRLEGVVELRDLHHRLEELAQVEQERREHADGDVAVVGPVAAVQQDDRDRDVADQPDPRHEPGHQPERHQVGAAVLVVDVVEDLLVARLATEGLDGADAAHGLDEVHDHQRDLLAGDRVALGGVLAEPGGEPEQERPAAQGDQPELDVEEEQDAGGADQGERRGDEPVEAGLEHLVDGVDVGGLPADDAAGRVGVVERGAEHLEVPEDPAPDLEEDVLADGARTDQEELPGDRLHDGGDQHHRDDGEERVEVVALADGRDAGVDALLDEVGDGEARGVLHDDDRDEDLDRPLVRRQQLAQQPLGPASEPRPGHPLGGLVGVDLGDPAPLLLRALVGRHGTASLRSASAASSSR